MIKRVGWKEIKQEEYPFTVRAGFDPNDLQAQDNALFGKPCCGGSTGQDAIYASGKWHSLDCDSLRPPANLPNHQQEPDYRPVAPNKGRCTCGSAAVGSDRHSFWCDIEKK